MGAGMPLLEAIRMALETIRTQKLKSFFSLLGVLIGVTFLIAVVSIIEGMNVYMENEFATAFVGVNTVVVRQRPTESFTESATQRREWNRRPPLRDDDARYLATWIRSPVRFARTCDAALPVEARGRVARGISVIGTEEAYFDIKRLTIGLGRPFTAPEVRAGTAVVVLGWVVANRLLPGGDPIGRSVRIMGVPHRVVGVVEAQGEMFGSSLDKFVVVPLTGPVRRFLCPGHTLDMVNLQAVNGPELAAVLGEAQGVLRRHRGLKPGTPDNFTMETSEGALGTWKQISSILIVALPSLVAVSLVVGGIVIMNIMLMAVAERTREIGIRKALGARRSDIVAQFLAESAALSTLGAVFGIGSGLVLAMVIRSVSPLPAAVAPWSVAVAVTLGVAVGISAGLYPAVRASRLDPIDALRAE